MVSQKLYNGIAHDIAHHAASGLSYLHPHLAKACKVLGVNEVSMSLLDEQSFRQDLLIQKPLQLSSDKVKEKFREMILQAQLDTQQLEKASLHFQFIYSDDYSCVVTSLLKLKSGREFTHTIKPNYLEVV